MTTTAPIPVVCAVIEQEGCVLIAQRPADKHLPFKWEFPGGKVEPNESPAAAIVREIQEELGCIVHIIRALPPFVHHYPRATIEMIPFVCQLGSGSPAPHPHEHVALAWINPEELINHDLAAADLPVIASYCGKAK